MMKRFRQNRHREPKSDQFDAGTTVNGPSLAEIRPRTRPRENVIHKTRAKTQHCVYKRHRVTNEGRCVGAASITMHEPLTHTGGGTRVRPVEA